MQDEAALRGWGMCEATYKPREGEQCETAYKYLSQEQPQELKRKELFKVSIRRAGGAGACVRLPTSTQVFAAAADGDLYQHAPQITMQDTSYKAPPLSTSTSAPAPTLWLLFRDTSDEAPPSTSAPAPWWEPGGETVETCKRPFSPPPLHTSFGCHAGTPATTRQPLPNPPLHHGGSAVATPWRQARSRSRCGRQSRRGAALHWSGARHRCGKAKERGRQVRAEGVGGRGESAQACTGAADEGEGGQLCPGQERNAASEGQRRGGDR